MLYMTRPPWYFGWYASAVAALCTLFRSGKPSKETA
jgi:hypothetical protein